MIFSIKRNEMLSIKNCFSLKLCRRKDVFYILSLFQKRLLFCLSKERKKRKTRDGTKRTYHRNQLYRSRQNRSLQSSCPILHSSIDHPILSGSRVSTSLGCNRYLGEEKIADLNNIRLI